MLLDGPGVPQLAAAAAKKKSVNVCLIVLFQLQEEENHVQQQRTLTALILDTEYQVIVFHSCSVAHLKIDYNVYPNHLKV